MNYSFVSKFVSRHVDRAGKSRPTLCITHIDEARADLSFVGVAIY